MTHRDIALIGSTIVNGRIYFPSTDVKFFPADSFGDRIGDGHKGVLVAFRGTNLSIDTDIRVVSGKRLSPRASFSGFLSQFGAVEGAVLRFTRTGVREYQVSYLG